MGRRLIITLVVFIILIIGGFFIFSSPKGELLLQGDNFREFVFSKNSDYVLFSEGDYSRSVYDRETGESVYYDIPLVWKIADLEFKKINIIPEVGSLVNSYKVFSPSGEKILYPGKRLDEDYPGAVATDRGLYIYEYYNLYVYDTKTKNSEKVTLELNDLMYSQSQSFYAWIDENNIIYRCRPGGENFLLPEGYLQDEYNLATYCRINLINKEVFLDIGTPRDFYDGETNVESKEDISRRTPKSGCLPSFDRKLCVYEETTLNFFETQLKDYKLYIKEDGKSKLVYKGDEFPKGVYWSKDDKLYVVLEDEIRVLN